ncbi:transposase domain-containing protein [Streptomyces sp. AK08-01B]|uniref:transposase domain-containing protein n=1 Tax=unclassified Streptomyces TaxID=2593676 RepID=UPI0039F61513
MPRAGHLKSSGERLSDQVSVGVLTSALPQSLVDEELVETGRVQQRNRLLPARWLPTSCSGPARGAWLAQRSQTIHI